MLILRNARNSKRLPAAERISGRKTSKELYFRHFESPKNPRTFTYIPAEGVTASGRSPQFQMNV